MLVLTTTTMVMMMMRRMVMNSTKLLMHCFLYIFVIFWVVSSGSVVDCWCGRHC